MIESVNSMDNNLKTKDKRQYFTSIDGLRAISCLGIILMHVQANTAYRFSENFLFDQGIPSLTWLVYLFMMISGFAMCVSYLHRFHAGTVDLEEFYKKRYRKILPFFGFLLLIALVMEHSLKALYEVSLEALLLYGFLPNNLMSVLGVCWTLGVIFVFYLLFPAYSVLMKNKRRAWASLLLSLWIVFVCQQHFFTEYYVAASFQPRQSFIYCLPMFIAGGLLYLYVNEIREICARYRWGILILCLVFTILWYVVKDNNSMIFYLKTLIMYGCWLFYGIGVDSKFLSCRVLKYLSGISMEMYLSQMIIFRLVEKTHLSYLFGDAGTGGWIGFLLTFIMTVIGLILFIEVYKKINKIVSEYCMKHRKE